MIDPIALIHKYYYANEALEHLLVFHSRQVTDKALSICDAHPELALDRHLVYWGAMLHDIGIIRTDAGGIHCHGDKHYLYHGILGAEMMRKEAECYQKNNQQEMTDLLLAVARICERHTGTGMKREDFFARGLMPPTTDLLPETLEEQVVCYADKFYSKSHLERVKTIAETTKSLAKFGEEHAQIFKGWSERFE